MYLIGLTGSIATGKSTIRGILQELGAWTVDADLLSHAAILPGMPAWQEIVRTFGDSVVGRNAHIDRVKLGALVFPDPARLKALEAIVHPQVSRAFALLLAQSTSPVAVIEAVKLLESPLLELCDSVWLVTCDPAEMKRRLIESRQLTETQADARLQAQPPLDTRQSLANVVVDNSGPIAETRRQVQRAWDQINPSVSKPKTDLLCRLLSIGGPAPAAVTHLKPPAPITRPSEVTIVRARRGDVELLQPVLAQVEGRSEPLSRAETMQHFGRWAYWLALEGGRPLGMVAWQAENLVGIAREFWFERVQDAPLLLPRLLASIEEEAALLECEVLILLLRPQTLSAVTAIAQERGYASQEIGDLHRIWREIAREHLEEKDSLWLKRLRQDMVTRPI